MCRLLALFVVWMQLFLFILQKYVLLIRGFLLIVVEESPRKPVSYLNPIPDHRLLEEHIFRSCYEILKGLTQLK